MATSLTVQPDIRKQMIAQMLREGTSSAPVQHWTQGAARVAQALIGGLEAREVDREGKENEAAQNSALAAMLGGNPLPTAAPPVTPPSAPPMSSAPPMQASRPPASMPPQNVSGPVPPNDPTMTVAPRQVQMANGPQQPPTPPPITFGDGVTGQPGQLPPPGPSQSPAMPATSSAAPQEMQARVQAMLNDPNPAVRALGKQFATQLLAQRMKPEGLKSVVVGDKAFSFNERTGQWVAGPDATKATDDERNLASENKARVARGEQPLSLLQYEQMKKAAGAQGAVQGETAAMLPAAESRADRALQGIDEIRNHPGRLHGFASNAAGLLQGTPQYDFKKRVDQLKGGAFLEAFQMLKGGGAVTEAEGTKASIAMERMDRALSKKDFDAALDDYQSAVRDGLAKLKLKAKGEANIGGSQSAQAAQGGAVRRYNPATGRIE
jgi:hypothetical protein